jgi:hypothetical protein
VDAAKTQLTGNRQHLVELAAKCNITLDDGDDGIMRDFKSALESWDLQATNHKKGQNCYFHPLDHVSSILNLSI